MKTPHPLLRIFDKEDYACQFIQGKIRVGLLDWYRACENKRRDETEGKVLIRWDLPNPVHCESSSLNPRYILSTSHPDAYRQFLKEQFGPYTVRIDDPAALLERIESAWQKHPLARGHCIIQPVVYNKGELLSPAPYLISPSEYSYCQKPKEFEGEREFRYILTCIPDAVKLEESAALWKDHLTLQLSDCSDICSLI